MSGHDAERAERAYVQARLDHRAAQLADATASIQAELDHLRESWSSGTDLDGHQDRMQAAQEETRRYLAQLAGTGSAPIDPQQGRGVVGASVAGSSSPAGPGGPGPAGQHPITDADIAAMSMAEYQAFRARIGMGNASGRGMFG